MNDQRHLHSSLSPRVFAGSYEDAIGVEEITWVVKPSTRRSPPGQSGFEFWTTVRGVAFWGYDLDGLEAEDPALAASQGFREGGHGLLGMRCHRNAKQQYLAVRSKPEYWRVPVTEEVMETHHCDELQPT